jgi:hypothetical protein
VYTTEQIYFVSVIFDARRAFVWQQLCAGTHNIKARTSANAPYHDPYLPDTWHKKIMRINEIPGRNFCLFVLIPYRA